ncbi:hypothetical protein JCM11251_002816 [Rhodosporidiobolus azoricus]
MTTLALSTSFPNSDNPSVFSVLPSPSTFGLSSRYSHCLHDYPTWDYTLDTLDSTDHPPPHSPTSHADSPRSNSSSSSSTASSDHASSSPASSFRSTPAHSPNAVKLALPRDELEQGGPFDSAAQHTKLFSPSPTGIDCALAFGNSSAAPPLSSSFVDSGEAEPDMYAQQQYPSSQPLQDQARAYLSPAAASLDGTVATMSAAGFAAQQQLQPVYAQPPQQQAYYDLTSSSLLPLPVSGHSAVSASTPVYTTALPSSLDYHQQGQAQVVYAQQQPQASYQPHPHPHSHPAPTQIQPATPLQLVTLNGVTYAVPVAAAAAAVAPAPVAAPAPAAIETPHGTYYFVPTAPAPAHAPVMPLQQPQSSPFVLSSGLPAPVAASIPGLSPLSSAGPSPTLSSTSVSSSSTPTPASASSAIEACLSLGIEPISAVPSSLKPTPLDPQQKIRLPVGQGKRGSTKRKPSATARGGKEQVKRFVCPFEGCGRGFARNFNMQSHYASHLGVRNFTCPHCPKKFSRRHDRARHCAAVHDSHVDRDGNILGLGGSGSGSAEGSPSSSSLAGGEHDELGHDHDHDHEYSAPHPSTTTTHFGFDLDSASSAAASSNLVYSVDQHHHHQSSLIGSGSGSGGSA